jgi:hypothetical protein
VSESRRRTRAGKPLKSVRCRFCGIERKETSALMIHMADGRYRCKGAMMCLRRVRALQ